MSLVKVPLKIALLDELKSHYDVDHQRWVSGDQLEKFSQRMGFKASTGARVLRKFSEKKRGKRPLIEKSEINGWIHYKFLKVCSEKNSKK